MYQSIPLDIIINCVIPYTNYFDIVITLRVFGVSEQKIESIRQIEYDKRISTSVVVDHYMNWGDRSNPYNHIHHTEYRIDGVIHRDVEPAIIRCSETLEWYSNGKLHREDGAAIHGWDMLRRREFYIHGQRHRVNGPAVWIGGKPEDHYEWWINDVFMAEYNGTINYFNTGLDTFLRIHNADGSFKNRKSLKKLGVKKGKKTRRKFW